MDKLAEFGHLITPATKPLRFTQICWWVMFVFAVPIAGLGILMIDARSAQAAVFGQAWIDATHFIGGGIALLVGAFGLHRGILKRAPKLHRSCGFVYFACVIASGGAGLAMATQSAGADHSPKVDGAQLRDLLRRGHAASADVSLGGCIRGLFDRLPDRVLVLLGSKPAVRRAVVAPPIARRSLAPVAVRGDGGGLIDRGRA